MLNLRPFKPLPGIRHLGEPIEEKTFNRSMEGAGMSRSLHTTVEESSFALVKTIPALSAHPFKAVNAVSAVNAPALGCQIQDNDRE